MVPAFLFLAGLAAIGLMLALLLWPRRDPDILLHEHPDLLADHPHLMGHRAGRHEHAFVIDDLHTSWPGKV